MKTNNLAIAVLVLTVSACTDIGLPIALSSRNPDWVNRLIIQFENAPVANPPQSIWQYQFKGQTVYYVPPQCCDVPSVLYDEDGNAMCAPDGGFIGSGDGRCPDFFQQRTNELLIWRDSRLR